MPEEIFSLWSPYGHLRYTLTRHSHIQLINSTVTIMHPVAPFQVRFGFTTWELNEYIIRLSDICMLKTILRDVVHSVKRILCPHKMRAFRV
jgi:hypothetical protein